MPLSRPTLPELIDQGAAEFEGRLPGVLVRLRNSVIGVLNRVQAEGLNALYHYADYLNDQSWPHRADADALPDHGALRGVYRLPAAAATGTVLFGGVDGSTIEQGTVVQRSDGVQYATTQEGQITSGEAAIAVQAVEPGQLGNAAINTALTLASPIAGVNAYATAQVALAGGADLEDIEAWRARILARWRKPPQGGSASDYEAWALAVPGVTRVWVYPAEQGAGTVVVRFVRAGDANPIPDAGEVSAVQAAIDAERPVTADVYVVAPIATPQNFTISITPDTAATRAAVQAELQALYERAAVPGGTMLISQQREAISSASGETDHVLSVPSANQTHSVGQLPTLGTITWV